LRQPSDRGAGFGRRWALVRRPWLSPDLVGDIRPDHRQSVQRPSRDQAGPIFGGEPGGNGGTLLCKAGATEWKNRSRALRQNLIEQIRQLHHLPWRPHYTDYSGRGRLWGSSGAPTPSPRCCATDRRTNRSKRPADDIGSAAGSRLTRAFECGPRPCSRPASCTSRRVGRWYLHGIVYTLLMCHRGRNLTQPIGEGGFHVCCNSSG
jgi:hypothetical protein